MTSIVFVFFSFAMMALMSLVAQSAYRSAVVAKASGEIELKDFRYYVGFLAVTMVGMYVSFLAMLFFMGVN